MNLNETKMLLSEISSVDNRKLDESLAVSWQADPYTHLTTRPDDTV